MIAAIVTTGSTRSSAELVRRYREGEASVDGLLGS